MTTDIFIKTCNHDAEYHKYCLESIEKYCSGFRNTVVVEGEHPKGYLQQQVVKLHADEHTDADYILITDSDTLFNQPVTPESFFRDGKIIWMITPYDEAMMASPGTRAWYECMKDFTGVAPLHEKMRRQPFMIPSWLFKEVRQFCWTRFGRTMEQYVMERGVFSEFNCIAHYAWLHHHEKFYWMDSSVECPPPVVRQFWSHDKIEKNIEEIQQILA